MSKKILFLSAALIIGVSLFVGVQFSLAADPSITVLSPNGGETWNVGETKTVTWKIDANDSNIVIGDNILELWSCDYSASCLYVENINNKYGSWGENSYSWKIPSVIGGIEIQPNVNYTYKIKVRMAYTDNPGTSSQANKEISDISDSYFTVTASSQSSFADFVVTEVGVKYYALVLNEINEGNHYYAIVKNIGGDFIFTDSLASGNNNLEIRFEGSTGWMAPNNEVAYRNSKQYEKGDKINKNQEIEFVAPSASRVPAGVYSIKATVNPEQTSSSIKYIIEEGDYSNNSLTKTVTIGSSVLAPVVLSPNGGETFNAPSPNRMEYSFKSLPGKSHNVYLFDESRQIRILIIGGVIGNSGGQEGGAANLGYYDNIITGSKYKLEVCSDPDTALTVCDKSDSYFTIGASSNQFYDWEISNLTFSDGIPSYGKDLSISYQVKNNSSVYKEIEFRVAFYLDDVFIKDIGYVPPSEALNVGVAKNYTTTIPASLLKLGAQVIELKLIVNTGEESNILNNKVGAGINIFKASDTQITQITTNANLLINDKMSEILAELNQLRSIIKEQQTQIIYLSSLLKDVQGISAASQAVLNNFITYGVDANTVKLGAGERAAVINSYKFAFDKLPTTEAELADVIKIANGRWPSLTNQDAENQAKAQFQKIYKRAADMNGANDNAAVTIMAYGLRQKAENRNLNSEVNGIKIFKAIYGHTPKTTEEWNAMQAITYSGATQKTWSGYNPNGN